jgi:RNA polymerase sigma-70 factor (ECF subfamily)
MNPQLGLMPSDYALASDAALMSSVAERGERLEAAFQELHDRHYQPTVNFLVYSRHLAVPDAEDIASEAFLRVFGKADTFDPSVGSFRSWLYRIALNKAGDTHRSRRREESLTDPDADRLAAAEPNLTDTEMLVAACVRRLHPKQRMLIHLKYFEGFTELEIASLLGLPKGTVSTRLCAARNALRAMLDGAASPASPTDRVERSAQSR